MPNTKPKYLVSADFDVKPEIPKDCEWISENNDWEFTNNNYIVTEEKYLSWCEFSSSLAVNFLILRGYKEIYIAGVDLIEDGKPLFHYDGILNKECTDTFRCKKEKEYINNLAQLYNISIFNLNPACDWLKVADLGILK